MSFGEQIQFFRKKNNLTQEQLAEELRVSRQAISKWEQNMGYPEVDKIIYFCNKYRVSVSELFKDEINLESAGKSMLPKKNDTLWVDMKNFYHNSSREQRLLIKLISGIFLVAILSNAYYIFGTHIGEVIYYITH